MLDLEHRSGELAGTVAGVAGTLGELEHDQHLVGLLLRDRLNRAAARQQAVPFERILLAGKYELRVLDHTGVLGEERGRIAIVVAVQG